LAAYSSSGARGEITPLIASRFLRPAWLLGFRRRAGVADGRSSIASVSLFAWATLGRLGWAGQSWQGDTVVERLDQVLFWASYWLGNVLLVYWQSNLSAIRRAVGLDRAPAIRSGVDEAR